MGDVTSTGGNPGQRNSINSIDSTDEDDALEAAKPASIRPAAAAGSAQHAKRHRGAAASFRPAWPRNYKKKLEAATLERAHEADVTPTVFDFELWRRHRSRLRYVEHLVTLAQ